MEGTFFTSLILLTRSMNIKKEITVAEYFTFSKKDIEDFFHLVSYLLNQTHSQKP